MCGIIDINNYRFNDKVYSIKTAVTRITLYIYIYIGTSFSIKNNENNYSP